jgi:AcrR family transcriptional regulator
MPKTIKNVNKKIIESAVRLFSKKGYQKVKMVDIAVGTLYNYYKNKRTLFWAVIERQFSNLYAKLTTIISNNGNNNINEFITVLYDEIIKINGLSGELLSLSKEDEVIIKSLKKDLLDFINQIVSKKNNQNEDQLMKGDQERLVRIILLAIINLSREYPEEREANILFISNLINKLTK